VKTVGVVGAGQMGGGIAQVASQVAGVRVVLVDSQQSQLERALQTMDHFLAKNIAKGKITEQVAQETKARITTSTDVAKLVEADFIVEAASENVAIKEKIFKELVRVANPEAILASNTSSISITKIGAFTSRPEKVVGMHFMNPVPIMQLVEIIPGLATSQHTLSTTLALAKAMGKTTAQSDDRPGFIANRLLCPYLNEAINALQDGLGSREDIDITLKLGCNMPMGPLTLADFIGLDTVLAIMRVLHSELGEDKFRPSPLLIKYVDAGWLGVKSGKGFYDYSKKK
jgi:3-hydroxybutyryl-CoA dehydrogenase